jgi:citrate lyase subunit beta / citryl-CoA lyase
MYEDICGLERSWLFVPGDRPEMFSKAFGSGSDAVILDLEDSVPFDRKEFACESILAFLERTPVSSVWLRPSKAVPDSGSAELRLCGHPAIRGLVLPKVESPEEVIQAREVSVFKSGLIVLIESARSLARAQAIARVAGITRLCFGSLDFLCDVRATSNELVRYSLMHLVVMSRDAGIAAPIAGVTTSIHDAAELARETSDAISLGCFGKLCIHPCQVPIVNSLHRPTKEKIAWAKAVISLASGEGVFVYEGKMIDAPVLREAETILQLAARTH